jgi:acyl homoserine lactone synthase
MIRVTRGYDIACAADAAMFEDRRRLFVDLLRWDVPVVGGRFEIDQFDGPNALYVSEVELGGNGVEHRGSLRLLPTFMPHLLGSLFADLVDGDVPSGIDVMEITRLCLPQRLSASVRLAVRNRLISVMVEECLRTGVSLLTGLVRPDFRDTVLKMGWRGRSLGPVRAIGGLPLGAFAIEIDERTPSLLEVNGIYTAGLAPIALATAA